MIEFQNVSFSYSNNQDDCLKDINITIPDGQCVLFCGRSGCGKTTLTRLINGLIPQFFSGKLSGKVLLDKENIFDLPMYKISKKVGSVFQNPRTQFFNVDTDSEIAFGMENAALMQEKLKSNVMKTAKELNIVNLLGRNIFALSGGEKQKIAFASVYATNPNVYLLDEPSSNLDMKSISELKENLRLVKSQGKTIIIAEHRIFYLSNIVDRVIYLEGGRIVKDLTFEQFSSLTINQRHEMGLRAINLLEEEPIYPLIEFLNPILELKNISLSYKKQTILQNISLQIGLGEVIAISGHNGVGKTTFSRALCGLHKENNGKYYWNQKPLNNKERMKRSYMVMQDVNYQLFAESVEEECTFGINHPNINLAKKTLEDLGLALFAKRHPNTLSGGQKQRLAAAVSMVCEKELLIFDEPTSGLDFDSMMRLSSLIHTLSTMGKIIFIVTHDYEFVCKTCKRILYLDEGTIKDDLLLSKNNFSKIKDIFEVK